MKTWIIVAVAGIALLGAAWGASGWLTGGLPVDAARVDHGQVRQFVDERGKTRLPQTHQVTMPIDGRIEEITLAEGDVVQKGQVLARMAPDDLDDMVARAQAAVQRLEAQIHKNDDRSVDLTAEAQADHYVQSMIPAVAAAKQRTISGRKRRDVANSHLDRLRESVESGSTTQDELELAELRQVESQVDYDQDLLVYQALLAIQSATELMPELIRQNADRKILTRAVLEKELSEARIRLNEIDRKTQRGTMRWPYDDEGVVLNRAVQNERHLAAGTLLLKIGRPQDLEIEADLLSQDVVLVRPGQEVSVYGSAIGRNADHGVAGKVQRIYPAGFTKVSSLGVEQQRVRVVVELDPQALDRLRREYGLGVGYRVRVRIYTGHQESALILPRSALFRGADGSWRVFAIRHGRAVRQDVQVGLMNDYQTQITRGLQAGETVILAPETSLQDGAKVEPAVR